MKYNMEENVKDTVSELTNQSYENVNKLTSIQSTGKVEITACIKEAHDLVDKVIEQSSKYILNLEKGNDESVPDVQWLMIDEFTVENGLQKIEEFIKTWERGAKWLYCIDFLCQDSCDYSQRYRYRVQWSIPTRRKPIPRATASVYFTIDVSDVMPKSHLVKAYYIFESSKLVHRPGESRFREKWLKDIIDAKITLMEQITF